MQWSQSDNRPLDLMVRQSVSRDLFLLAHRPLQVRERVAVKCAADEVVEPHAKIQQAISNVYMSLEFICLNSRHIKLEVS